MSSSNEQKAWGTFSTAKRVIGTLDRSAATAGDRQSESTTDNIRTNAATGKVSKSAGNEPIRGGPLRPTGSFSAGVSVGKMDATGDERVAQKRRKVGFATALECMAMAETAADHQERSSNASSGGMTLPGSKLAPAMRAKCDSALTKRGIPSTFGSSTAKEDIVNAMYPAGNESNEYTRPAFGFSTAKEYMEESAFDQERDSNTMAEKDAPGMHQAEQSMKSEPTKVKSNAPDENASTVHLTVRGIKYHKENIQSLDTITLDREPENSFDANAICAKNGDGNIVGHIAKEQAAVLANPIDDGTISLENVALEEQRDTILLLTAEINLLDEDKRQQFDAEIFPKIKGIQTKPSKDKMQSMITEEAVQQLAQGITAQDAETASTCRFDILEMSHLPWKKNSDGTTATWPPSQDFLDTLGYGGVDDEQWWQDNTGLKPPCMWNVTGALDLLPKVPIPSHQKSRASEVLDDAVHGCTNTWSDRTLEEVRCLMHSTNFWCHRGSDAFIRAFGGPYVLGQKEGKLKLIQGAKHTPLTEKICRGHNVVYELVHSAKPPEPGFNTIIFGLNLRRSGFHYHCDTIASLKAKNAPLVLRQPVVTTVYYEKPEVDNGKELVLWKPMLNFKPRDDSLYAAARGIQTLHGMVHVQKAGLQSKAQHGIFHTPVFNVSDEVEPVADARKGYRVAITARITFPDADQRLQPYLENEHYSRVLGPDGNKTLAL